MTKILFLLPALIILASCNDAPVPAENTSQEQHSETAGENEVVLTNAQFKAAGITYGPVELKQISGTFKANGLLDVPPQNMVSISVPMGGFLKTTSMLQGKRVKRGELIAVIENPEYVQMQQDYLEAKSQLEYAKADYERQQTLAKENVNAQKTLQLSKANYQSLDAKTKGLREKIMVSGINMSELEKGNIQSAIYLHSPINGFVTQVNANIGKFINPTDVLVEIVDTEHLHAELTVFEKDVPKLEIGQKVRFTLANETKERTAKVYLIGREISKDRTVRIHCHIDEEDIHLLPGMYLKATVETGGVQVAALPNEAIVDSRGQPCVFVPAESDSLGYHFTKVPIQVGNSDGGYTEVTLPGEINKDKIVVKGAYDLLSKMMNSEDEGHAH